MCSKSKVLVVTLTHASLYAFASDVARSCKTTVPCSCNGISTICKNLITLACKLADFSSTTGQEEYRSAQESSILVSYRLQVALHNANSALCCDK